MVKGRGITIFLHDWGFPSVQCRYSPDCSDLPRGLSLVKLGADRRSNRAREDGGQSRGKKLKKLGSLSMTKERRDELKGIRQHKSQRRFLWREATRPFSASIRLA